MEWNEQLKQFTRDHQQQVVDLIRTLVAIPAFSNHEEQRAQFCAQWFRERGAQRVHIDSANNVIVQLGPQQGNKTVFMAHLDTVFPDETGFELIEEDGWLKAPGVGDDTANVALLMVITEYLLQHELQARRGILIVLNAGEEGLGNLKGCRQLMQDYGDQVDEVFSFDGSYTGFVNRAVGSLRYRVEVLTEGGHSYGAFGNRNAIRVLSSIIETLYSVKVPQGGKTTYNVGTIQGGTSVNTIAQQAEMLFEFRSDVHEHLEQMRDMFETVLEAYRKSGVEVNAEILGQRPCMGEIDVEKQQEMESRLADLIERRTGQRPQGHSGSTDCNIPFSMGINALCFGGYLGQGAHTRQEKVEKASLQPGLAIMMEWMLNYFD